MYNLNNRVAVFTGSCTGIRLEVAKTLKKQKSIVVMTYYEEEKQQEESYAKLIEKYKFDLGLGIDVTKTESVQDCFTRISEKFGRIDILVNNASINLVGDFDKIDDEMWKKVIDTNLKVPSFACVRFIALCHRVAKLSI